MAESKSQTVNDVVRKAQYYLKGGKYPQAFLATEDVNRARAVACELGRILDGRGPLPVYVLSGRETAEHNRLFDPQIRSEQGALLPQDTRIVLLIEYFDSIPRGMQRAYAHLVDGGDPQNGLAAESVLLLHAVGSNGHDCIERGTLDRGVWLRIDRESDVEA